VGISLFRIATAIWTSKVDFFTSEGEHIKNLQTIFKAAPKTTEYSIQYQHLQHTMSLVT